LLNISTRLRVQGGDNVLIGGFIVTGNSSKTILVRGLGPSISVNGVKVPGRLADPFVELRKQDGSLVATNNDWKDSQRTEIEATGLAPKEDFESAIARNLKPGGYTVVMRSNNGGTGIGLIEAYDLDKSPQGKLANISSRGFVESGDNVMIGGFISGPSNRSSANVVVRAMGPSLESFGVPTALQDPTLEIHNQNGTTIAINDNWATDSNAAKVLASGLAPRDARESAIYLTLAPAQAYTAIVQGKNNSTGIGLVEVYNVK
jgi:archaellum component FlaF (FlaF/FlaG flagellin family)